MHCGYALVQGPAPDKTRLRLGLLQGQARPASSADTEDDSMLQLVSDGPECVESRKELTVLNWPKPFGQTAVRITNVAFKEHAIVVPTITT